MTFTIQEAIDEFLVGPLKISDCEERVVLLFRQLEDLPILLLSCVKPLLGEGLGDLSPFSASVAFMLVKPLLKIPKLEI